MSSKKQNHFWNVVLTIFFGAILIGMWFYVFGNGQLIETCKLLFGEHWPFKLMLLSFVPSIFFINHLKSKALTGKTFYLSINSIFVVLMVVMVSLIAKGKSKITDQYAIFLAELFMLFIPVLWSFIILDYQLAYSSADNKSKNAEQDKAESKETKETPSENSSPESIGKDKAESKEVPSENSGQ